MRWGKKDVVENKDLKDKEYKELKTRKNNRNIANNVHYGDTETMLIICGRLWCMHCILQKNNT
jgi:hypothetical protein